MKKTALIILSFLLLIINMVAVFGNTSDSLVMEINNPVMSVNGTDKEIDPGKGTTPIIVNGRTLLPVRAVMEELGGKAQWNGDKQEVKLYYGENIISLTINSQIAYFNDEEKTLDTAPAIINGRTMLPIRFIAECFGFKVDWNNERQTVTITKVVEETTVPAESKILVAYFSNTGNTEGIANNIATAMNADIYRIEALQPYTSADLDYNTDCRANREQKDDSARPEIANLPENIDEYDTIYLGYPIWWGQAPKIIYTFLEKYDFTGKTIIPFCTSGSSDIGSSDDNLYSSAKGANWVDGNRFSGNAASGEVSTWAKEALK